MSKLSHGKAILRRSPGAARDQQRGVKEHLRKFADAAAAWQKQHGYENHWCWDRLMKALKKLNQPEIREVLEPIITETGYDRVRRQLYLAETMTPHPLEAMRTALPRLAE